MNAIIVFSDTSNQLFVVWTDKLTSESFKWLFSFMFWGTGYYSSLLVVYMPVQIQSECELAYGKILGGWLADLRHPVDFIIMAFCYKYLSIWNLRLCVYTVSHYLWCDNGMETPKQEYRHSACTYGLIYSIHSCPCETIVFPMRDHKVIILQFKNNKKQYVIVIIYWTHHNILNVHEL